MSEVVEIIIIVALQRCPDFIRRDTGRILVQLGATHLTCSEISTMIMN